MRHVCLVIACSSFFRCLLHVVKTLGGIGPCHTMHLEIKEIANWRLEFSQWEWNKLKLKLIQLIRMKRYYRQNYMTDRILISNSQSSMCSIDEFYRFFSIETCKTKAIARGQDHEHLAPRTWPMCFLVHR